MKSLRPTATLLALGLGFDDPMHRELTFSCPPKGAPAPQPMPPLISR